MPIGDDTRPVAPYAPPGPGGAGWDVSIPGQKPAHLVLASVLVRLLEQALVGQSELAHRAFHDPLTGLANRALFHDRLVEALGRHRDAGRAFAVVLVDLDGFKAVNDAYGHGVGDELLVAVGRRLRGCARSGDTVARLGGDEFAVLLEGDAEAPAAVAERILSAVREPFHVAGRVLSVGASLGVVEPGVGERGLAPAVVLGRADGAMYAGKRRGKGTVVLYRPGLLGADDA